MEYAIPAVDGDWMIAVGLIHGYGAIAMHGSEGYRAELASVACLFTDAPEPPSSEHAERRQAVAAEYGAPCFSLEAAISIGFLGEMGVAPNAIEDLKAWIAAGRSPSYTLIESERRIAQRIAMERRVAQLMGGGRTNAEIARSTSLNSRAVEVLVRRIIEPFTRRARLRRQLKDLVAAHTLHKEGGR